MKEYSSNCEFNSLEKFLDELMMETLKKKKLGRIFDIISEFIMEFLEIKLIPTPRDFEGQVKVFTKSKT